MSKYKDYLTPLAPLFLRPNFAATITLLIFSCVGHISGAKQSDNVAPRFVSQIDSISEIVVRVKEGPSSLNKEIYRLEGDDPDGDSLTFGVLGRIGQDLLRIENIAPNKAVVYLRKKLDREITDSYTLILTLTDGKLGKGNFVSFLQH